MGQGDLAHRLYFHAGSNPVQGFVDGLDRQPRHLQCIEGHGVDGTEGASPIHHYPTDPRVFHEGRGNDREPSRVVAIVGYIILVKGNHDV